MKQLPWFRMFSEARTDAKLRTLADDEHRVWFSLLCLASEQGNRGTVELDPFLLAVEITNGDDELLARTLEKLERLRIVSRDTGVTGVTGVTFINFQSRQHDKPSDSPEQQRERKARQRARELVNSPTKSRKTEDVTPVSREVTRSHAKSRTRVEQSRVEQSRAEQSRADGDATRDESAASEAPDAERAPASGYRSMLDADWWEIVKEFKAVDAVLGNGWLAKAMQRAPPGLGDDALRDALENALNRIADDFQRDDGDRFIAKRYGWAATVLAEELADAKGLTT